MAGKPTPAVAKVSVECSHCHAKQLESVYAKSTVCRKCGQHLNLERQAGPEPGEASPNFFARIFAQFFQRKTTRDIRCFECGTTQQVTAAAKSSICPHCAHYIDLRDFKLAGAFSRTIRTQGNVTITPKGEVTSTRIECGGAMIQGKLKGALTCTGTVRVKLKGKVVGGIDAAHLVVEKNSVVEFVRPMKVNHIEIKGKVSARITADHLVTIAKTGSLDGVVYAKAINVEKGGVFHGELYIGRQDLAQTELLPSPEGSEISAPPRLKLRRAI
ncbi:MAG: polymer-forming cytoskeletal protein [Verrucomicrobiota bacterium]|nr:polymer-forming cytoskeletal protein [Verrucomicrobiota bacterium]